MLHLVQSPRLCPAVAGLKKEEFETQRRRAAEEIFIVSGRAQAHDGLPLLYTRWLSHLFSRQVEHDSEHPGYPVILSRQLRPHAGSRRLRVNVSLKPQLEEKERPELVTVVLTTGKMLANESVHVVPIEESPPPDSSFR